MEWNPNIQGLQELIKIFKQSRGCNNAEHQIIFQKITEYSKGPDFTNYLLYILNDQSLEEDIRQISGLTLKGIIERTFLTFNEEEIDYFKKNIFICYLDKKLNVRKTISNLVNTFLKIGGIELWPEVLGILYDNLDHEISVTMCLNTLNIIFEDSGNIIEDKYRDFVSTFSSKLLRYLNSIGIVEKGDNDKEENQDLMILVMTTLYILLENCPEAAGDFAEEVANTLIQLINCRNYSLRYRVGRCWLSVIMIKTQIFDNVSEQLFQFFTENLSVESYQMNFTAAEFYYCIVDEENGLLNNPTVMNFLKTNIRKLLPLLLHFAKLTPNDVSGLDTENKTFATPNKKFSHFNIEQDEAFEDEIIEEGSETYNPNWTLRKCCSKIIDRLSNIFHEDVIDTLKPYLENDLQDNDWKIKEKSILAFGAIAIGSYDFIKPDLPGLINYIILQLSDHNKFVRAISCWTLSRFTSFILDGDDNLFRLYLRELLKRFLDKESIVQDSSCAAFNLLVINASNQKLHPYLIDVFKIISSVFNQYKDLCLITLYETITLLTENFEEQFRNVEIISDLLISILKRWYDVVNSSNGGNSNEQLLKVENLGLFDLLCSILKVSGSLLESYFNDFFTINLDLIERNQNDREIVSKCLDVISILCQVFPEQVKRNPMKIKLLELSFKLIELHNIQNATEDNYLKQFILALIGDICKVDPGLIRNYIDFFIQLLIDHLFLPDSQRQKIKPNKISVCNNSCWTLGLISLYYVEKIKEFSEKIMERLIQIITKPRMNKSLAQNVSICIGRLALACPETVAKYIDNFLKQFCLSLKTMENSKEKQDAYNGLCKAIIINPGGTLRHFAFFCDALCQYSDPPPGLEDFFRNILMSYQELLKETWIELYNSFPEKLKKKIASRFADVIATSEQF